MATSGSDNESFEVKEILKQRKRKGVIEYLVRWDGYKEDDDTWEPAKSLVNCVNQIKKFVQSQDALKEEKKTRSKGRARSRSRGRSRSRARSKSKTRSITGTPKTKTSVKSKNSSPKIVLSSDDEDQSILSTPKRQSRRTEVITRTKTDSIPGRTETRSSVMKVTTNDDEPDNVKTTTVLREKREVKTIENNKSTAPTSDESSYLNKIWNQLDTGVLILFFCISFILLSYVAERYIDPEAIRKSVMKAFRSTSKYMTSQWGVLCKMAGNAWNITSATIKGK